MRAVKVLLAGVVAFLGVVGYAADEAWMLGPAMPIIEAREGGNQGLLGDLPTALGATSADVPTSQVNASGKAAYKLPEWEIGYVQERSQPQYWLGEKIQPPENVDWNGTQALWETTVDKKGFLFDVKTESLYTTEGGTRIFKWVLTDGTTREVPYIIGSVSATRPFRVFWTDAPYNSPRVDLSGKYVKFFGDAEVLTLEKKQESVTIDGKEHVLSETVTKGLYVDTTTSMLNAVGGITGQVVMAYYSEGSYTNLKDVIVVEVAEPQVIELKGTIGKALLPSGGGYETDRLEALPMAETETDNRGPYYYQYNHNTATGSYNAKHGNVYPLRPTVGESWLMPVYWMEYDKFKTKWHFELCHYECDWGEDAYVYVRGDQTDKGLPIFFSTDYTLELKKYQSPEGHATIDLGENSFTSDLVGKSPAEKGGTYFGGEGYALVQLTTTDDIWFLPIRSVLRTNESVFPADVAEWPVGTELTLRENAASRAVNVDASATGYLYKAVSGTNYNPAIYYEPEAENPVGIDPELGDEGIATEKDPSVLYAVAEDRASYLEVWWMRSVREEGMEKPIAIPALPQRYRAVWPEKYANPSIVIASQEGSANQCIMTSGQAAEPQTTSAGAVLPAGAWFDEGYDPENAPPDGGGGMIFWVNLPAMPSNGTPSRLLTLQGEPDQEAATLDTYGLTVDALSDGRIGVQVWSLPASGVASAIGSATSVQTLNAGWNAIFIDMITQEAAKKLQLRLAAINSTTLLSNELNADTVQLLSATGEAPAEADFSAVMRTNYSYGRMGGAADCRIPGETALGMQFANVAFYRAQGALKVLDIVQPYTSDKVGLSGLLVPAEEDGEFVYADAVTGLRLHSEKDVAVVSPGAPIISVGQGVEAEDQPTVYAQNDPSKDGYNPNEEHAFVRSAGNGKYTVYALRCDLNTDDSSKAGVLVSYKNNDGRPAMRWFDVFLTSAAYPELADDAVAGTAVPGPHPLDLLENPWMEETYWDEDGQVSPIYRDRKKQLWLRQAGTATVRMFYPMQEGFAFPSLPLTAQPEVGEPIPWLSCVTKEGGIYAFKTPTASVNSPELSPPCPWVWRVTWPESVPTMKVGQTLTTAALGLPEVWSAKSMAVIYPNPEDRNATVMLYDPTVARHPSTVTGVSKVEDVPEYFSFDLTDKGNVFLRQGKYYFRDLPPSLSGRFYFDTTAATVAEGFCLIGKREESAASEPVLYVNVLNNDERKALKALCKNSKVQKDWDAMVDALPSTASKPSYTFWLVGRESLLRTSYTAADHYALTAMGGKVGYVTLIENDGPETLGVQEGDAINMHVIKVEPEYFAGRVIAREDPENLLSQQLSILYTEAFAGEADDFEFEWKKAPPGRTDMSFDVYETVFGDSSLWAGLTRFIIGGQGDTLANMVNTFYAVRYRAKKGTSVWTTMKAALEAKFGESLADDDARLWSDWCGPTLAEGWVQRVLNNITPFSQRLQDLYNNKAETLTSMLQQAGAPYQGDIAMNQDNLNNVGLIQLYMTLLNKAESMSLALGINDGEANKQLLLAAERLADLYMVLGNEAYADALNPTIGFGASFGVDDALVQNGVDYGALSSELFCFDNQVPSLLDEELALLRGRSVTENYPLMTNAPYYNRLMWNFTRGITAGEVAYAVNYNTASTNGDAVIDENDAAKQYPQGHGDAYGHYLSAIKGFYRLLRNPYFTWNTSMGEMLLADAIVNVDYYDEQRFAEIAAAMADTAALTVDRTARKAYAEHGGGGAGYLDEKGERGFGYGEWGARGGIGALQGWMVANSLLPAAEDSSVYWQMRFAGAASAAGNVHSSTQLTNASAMSHDDLDGGRAEWTLEFQVADIGPYAGANGNDTATVLLWDPADVGEVAAKQLSVTVDKDGVIALTLGDETAPLATSLPEGQSLVAISHDRQREEETGELIAEQYTLRVMDAQGALVGSVTLTLGLDEENNLLKPLLGGQLIFGEDTEGRISEIRLWEGVRSMDELRAARSFVNPKSQGLLASLRTISESEPGATHTFRDDTDEAATWVATLAQWMKIEQNGSEIYFSDEGLERIDRTTVTALRSLTDAMTRIEGTVATLDMGLNPLGFSDSAIPFDLSAAELEEGKSHYEQIAERAEVALSNAATVLDRAQTISSQLRLLEETRQLNEDMLAKTEANYDTELIAIFGTPYSDDIGPGKTYVQGYEGPDLTHFMWMDLSLYGFDAVPTSSTNKMSVVTYDVPKWMVNQYIVNYLTDTTTTYTYKIRPDGLIEKPDSIKGTRRTQGELQEAYGEFLAVYREVVQAEEWYKRRTERLDAKALSAEMSLAIEQVKVAAMAGINIYKAFEANKRKVLQIAHDAADVAIDIATLADDSLSESFPTIMGAGLTVNMDPAALANAAINAGVVPSMITLYMARYTAQMGMTASDFSWIGDLISNELAAVGNFASATTEIRNELIEYMDAQMEAKNALENAYVRLVAAGEKIKSVQEKGMTLLQEREAYRARAVNKLTKARYNDMFFRQVQHQALDRYEAAFLLAQRYVYLAAQAYDYETGLLASEEKAGDAFRAEIVAARTVGQLDDGKPMLAGNSEAASLSDILARMNANWLVLKPRLGINNPQRDVTWFSLRTELLRITAAEAGDAAWRNALAARWVDDLSTVTGYASLCEPFADASTTAEPGLVIEFPSEILFSKNFFGENLAGGDSAFDPTYFATKIAGAGIKFEGYNLDASGNVAENAPLAKTPSVYLIPMGADRMRVPGGEKDQVLEYAVKDQVVPLPYAIGSAHLDDPEWMPSYSGTTGGVDIASRIRRYPSFRAAINDEEDESALRNTRLIGRSVWNTRWALIIPAGYLGNDRETALNAFIYGSDANRDGKIETPGIRDIKLGFRTYSHAGN